MSTSIVINNTTTTSVPVQAAMTLNHLTDVTIAGVQDSDRLVYDEATGKWVNEDTIDGGKFN